MAEHSLRGANLHDVLLEVIVLHRRRQRKLRLFTLACCRRLWRHLPGRLLPAAVGLAERFADGSATRAELRAGFEGAARRRRRLRDASRAAASAVRSACSPAIDEYALAGCIRAVGAAEVGASDDKFGVPLSFSGPEYDGMAVMLLDLFGNSFRPASLHFTWLTRDVLTLAGAAYQERQFPSGALDPARLALLADALEEAGCADAGFLGHLRSPGPHVRGCWAVDGLLGKS